MSLVRYSFHEQLDYVRRNLEVLQAALVIHKETGERDEEAIESAQNAIQMCLSIAESIKAARDHQDCLNAISLNRRADEKPSNG